MTVSKLTPIAIEYFLSHAHAHSCIHSFDTTKQFCNTAHCRRQARQRIPLESLKAIIDHCILDTTTVLETEFLLPKQ